MNTIERLVDLLEHLNQYFPDKQDLFVTKENSKWRKYGTSDYFETSNNLAKGLISLGLNAGDKIASVSSNRPEWNFVDMGSLRAGVIHVPVYPNLSNEHYKYIFEHADIRVLFVGENELYQRIAPVAKNIQGLEFIFTFDEISGALNWQDLRKMGEEDADNELEKELKRRIDAVDKDDVATIIYTSGTTGVPKGVMLSHWNFLNLVKPSMILFPFGSTHKMLSFLPLCHVFERVVGYYYQFNGISVYYAESIMSIARDFQDVKPDGFITVPRILEKIYNKIQENGIKQKGAKKFLFNQAMKFVESYVPGKKYKFPKSIWHKVVDATVFAKARKALGGNIKAAICGGAALHPDIIQFFLAAKIPVVEGYGLTEATALSSCITLHPEGIKVGTVGFPVYDAITIRIATDGEILLKGPSIMKGYYKDEEQTRKVIDENGWFHTGDVGEYDHEGFLKITDRKKEIFKLSTGKYVAPQMVENTLKASRFIEEAMVVGEGMKYAAAVLIPDFTALADWCREKGLQFSDHASLIADTLVRKLFDNEVVRLNNLLGRSEQIKKFVLIAESWTSESGALSPTLKLRRNHLLSHYSKIIKSLFDNA